MSLSELASYPDWCLLEAGVVGKLADNECKHDRLPGDTTPPCGCWPQEPAPTPAPAVTKEDAMELATANGGKDSEAPFGRFRNGRPRKRPARVRAATPPPAVSNDDATELSGIPKLRGELEEIRDGIQRQLDAVNAAIEALS